MNRWPRRARGAYACKRNDDKGYKLDEDGENGFLRKIGREKSETGRRSVKGEKEERSRREARTDQSRPSDRRTVVSRAST